MAFFSCPQLNAEQQSMIDAMIVAVLWVGFKENSEAPILKNVSYTI